MRSASGFIDALGGSTAVAAQLGLPSTTVASWKNRKSIPVEHWTRLVAVARECDDDELRHVSYETLVKMHTPETAGVPQ